MNNLLFLQNNAGWVVFIIIIILLLILFASSFRVVSQSNAYVIESLGRYHTTWGTGIHFLGHHCYFSILYTYKQPYSRTCHVLEEATFSQQKREAE